MGVSVNLGNSRQLEGMSPGAAAIREAPRGADFRERRGSDAAGGRGRAEMTSDLMREMEQEAGRYVRMSGQVTAVLQSVRRRHRSGWACRLRER